MDGFTEKKWFVYLGDHHEGPFSLEEIQTKMGQGQLSTTNYVWAEGMGDWKPMSEVQAFDSISLPQMPPPSGPGESSQMLGSGPTLEAAPSSSFSAISLEPAVATPILESAGPAILAEHTPQIVDAAPSPSVVIDEDGPTSDITKMPDPKKALAAQMVKLGLLLLFVAGIGIAYNEGYLNSFLNVQSVKSVSSSLMNAADPILSKLGFSPIPKLDDVDADEYEQLKRAAKADLNQAGPQIAIAFSKADLLTPTFYVASNLPDGTILSIYIEGIPDSLLNQLSFNTSTQVTITKKFGKSGPLTLAQGAKALPRGEYSLFIVDPETQPASVKPLIARMATASTSMAPVSIPKGLRVISTKSYFLGGFKDATYTARLQEFHAKLTARAMAELTELKQLAGTLDSELSDTTSKFAATYLRKKGKKITAAQKKTWDGFNTQWTAMNQQLGQTFAQLTPEALQNNYFYGPVYQLTQQVAEKLNVLHTLQNSYFTGPVADAKGFEIQLGEASSIAHSSIEELKAKIGQIESLPPTPNGLPRRDGI